MVITGGQFNSNGSYGFLNNGIVTITGGQFNDNGYAFANYYGTVTVKGGQFGNANGGLYEVYNWGGTVSFYGTFDHYGPLTSRSGSFSGRLADGTSQTIRYYNDGYGQISLLSVPEPSSALALLCGIGGLGGIILRRRPA